MSRNVDQLLGELENWFAACPGALVAFSGGVDSSLVAVLARRFLGEKKALAVISASPSLKRSELAHAQDFAQRESLPLRIIVTEEFKKSGYVENPTNRCYFCKSTLYDDLKQLEGFDSWWILNGTNLDDLGDHRPGLKAAAERHVRSPLADCRLTKADVRVLAQGLDLTCWDKPASPCLASRIPYGERVTLEKLAQIEAAEAILYQHGFPINRVRHFGDNAQVEVPRKDLSKLLPLQKTITPQLQKVGFPQVTYLEEGFRSGRLNDELNPKSHG